MEKSELIFITFRKSWTPLQQQECISQIFHFIDFILWYRKMLRTKRFLKNKKLCCLMRAKFTEWYIFQKYIVRFDKSTCNAIVFLFYIILHFSDFIFNSEAIRSCNLNQFIFLCLYHVPRTQLFCNKPYNSVDPWLYDSIPNALTSVRDQAGEV